MTHLRNSLICGLLAALLVVALQLTYLLAQLSASARRAEAGLLETNRQAQATLLYSQALLASVRGTTEVVRRSAAAQMGYYEAAGRRTSLALARLYLLIDHTDQRLERITQAAEQTSTNAMGAMDEVESLAASLREDWDALSRSAAELMDDSGRSVSNLNARLADEGLDRITDSLAASSQNAALATANVAEATGYIRDMLSPTKKSFWRRVLELLLPRPTVRVNKR